jgi:hypothetical protein
MDSRVCVIRKLDGIVHVVGVGSLLMRRNCIPWGQRRAVAAVEFSMIAPLLLLILISVWELGRIIQVNQILCFAARDAARVSAQAVIINSQGDATQIKFNSGANNIDDTIRDYLISSGITNLNGIQISFRFLEGDLSRTDPYLGKKNERFAIKVSIPYENIRWTSLSLFAPERLTVEVAWQMLVNDPFHFDDSMPGW